MGNGGGAGGGGAPIHPSQCRLKAIVRGGALGGNKQKKRNTPIRHRERGALESAGPLKAHILLLLG